MPVVYGRTHNITTDDIFRVEKWSKDITYWRENPLVMGKWVKRFDVEAGTQLINIPNVTRPPEPAAIDANGDMTDTTPATETQVQLLLDQRRGYIVNIPDDLSLQSTYDLAQSNLVAAAVEGGYGNLAFQREAIAMGILRDVQIKMLAETHFSKRIGISMYYGYIELRDNHGVRVMAKA